MARSRELDSNAQATPKIVESHYTSNIPPNHPSSRSIYPAPPTPNRTPIGSSMNALSVFGITGWILAGLGSALIFLGFLARRIVIHTSPHCANCKYPLADVPSDNIQTTCPECGRVPKNHTETYTMHSKRWCIPLGILFFAAALLLPHTNSIRTAGWTSVLPISSQIDLWPKGDPKLRERIFNAYAAGDLTKSQNTKLHTVLMQAFTDPQSSAPDAAALMDYLRHGMNGFSMFSETDCADGILNGSELVQKTIVTFISRQIYSTPQTPELREARRSIILSTTDDYNQRNAISWLITSPTDDPEDTQLIRDLIKSTDWDTAENTQDAYQRPDPLALDILSTTLTSETATARLQALNCSYEYLRRTRNPIPELHANRIAQLVSDPDPAVSKRAIELIEELPESAAPAIAEHLNASTDPEQLESLILNIRRMNSKPIQLLPHLAELAANPDIRLDATDAYFRIHARAGTKDPPPDLFPAYDALIQALVNEDYTTNFLIGSDITYHCHSWTATALSRHLITNNIAPDQLNQWFATHPAVTALLTIWEPLTFDSDLMPDLTPQLQSHPVHRFHKTLINAANRHPRSYDDVTNAADQALELYFPNQLTQPTP